MTDGHGRVVDFRNTIIIMTSNMGANALCKAFSQFTVTPDALEQAKDLVLSTLKEKVAPEFINRIDDIVMFSPLGKDAIAKIVRLQLDNLQRKLAAEDTVIEYGDDVVALLVDKGYVPEYGARPVKRAINEWLVNEMTMGILSGDIDRTKPVRISAGDSRLLFKNI